MLNHSCLIQRKSSIGMMMHDDDDDDDDDDKVVCRPNKLLSVNI